MRNYKKKPKKPKNWETLSNKAKIKWLKSLEKPNASEKKELKDLIFQEKFKGFAEFVKAKREQEKQTPEYLEQKLNSERKECRHRRGVRACVKCCRYAECYEGKPQYDPNRELLYGEKRLGLAIIVSALEDYYHAYRCGYKNELQSIRLWLTKSEQVDILSAGEYDGIALDENAYRQCVKKYGDFEIIFEKKQAKLKEKLAELEKRYDNSTNIKERKGLGIEINALKGRMLR